MDGLVLKPGAYKAIKMKLEIWHLMLGGLGGQLTEVDFWKRRLLVLHYLG